MEAVAQALPVPAGRLLVPEILLRDATVGGRAFTRRARIPAGLSDVECPAARGYLPEAAAPTGLLVDVYG